MTDVFDLIDLASERLGAAVLWATDEFFGTAESLIRASAPIALQGHFTDRGKWVDGWETQRRRGPGHDACILRLGLPGVLRGIIVDTSHFGDTFPERCSIEGCVAALETDVDKLLSPSMRWVEIVPPTPLQGNVENAFVLDNPHRFTHLRLRIYPDGGVARLRAHGEVIPSFSRAVDLDRAMTGDGGSAVIGVDLAAAGSGGKVLECSGTQAGSRHHLIMPGLAARMDDGWETPRRRGPGSDWALLELGAAGVISRVEVDTDHFKGSHPEACSLEGCDAAGAALSDLTSPARIWRTILPRSPLQGHARHVFVGEVRRAGAVTHVRFNIHPDGGVSRLRVIGAVSGEGRQMLGVRRLNTLLPEDAEEALRRCCGAEAWVRRMVETRPFASPAALFRIADEVWLGLRPEDWIEALRYLARLGDIGDGPGARQSQGTSRVAWTAEEQEALLEAPVEVLSELSLLGRRYEAAFGFHLVVDVAGKRAEELLSIARARLSRSPSAELSAAAEEQRKITRRRLAAWLLG
jgi:allantoicase